MEVNHNVIVVTGIGKYGEKQVMDHSQGTWDYFLVLVLHSNSLISVPIPCQHTGSVFWLLFLSARLVCNKASLISDLIMRGLTWRVSSRPGQVQWMAQSFQRYAQLGFRCCMNKDSGADVRCDDCHLGISHSFQEHYTTDHQCETLFIRLDS